MGVAERVSGWFDAGAAIIGDSLGRNVWQHCMLQTADMELGHALVADNGELVSIVKVRGRRKQTDGKALTASARRIESGIASRFKGAEHALQIVMTCDPEAGKRAARTALAPSRRTAKALGLEVGGVLDDWADRLGSYVAEESVYLACWTTREALVPAERKRAGKERGEALGKSPHGLDAQNIAAALPGLRDVHRAYVNQILSACGEAGLVVEALPAHDAVRALREMIEPDRTSEDWRPLLPGDPLPVREPAPTDGKRENSWWLYPPVKRQIFNRNIHEYTDTTAEIGGRLHHPVMVTLPPQSPQPFSVLFAKLVQRPMAWRVSILLEGDGLRGATLRSALARVLSWASTDNKMLTRSIAEARADFESNENQVRIRIVADTWTPATAKNASAIVQRNADYLVAALQSWGQCQATDVIGDPTLGVCAALPAVMRTAPCVPACAPLNDALILSPLARPAAVWEAGSVLLRTPDGKLTPYAPGSSKQTAWIEIVVAPMGRGKSVWLNTENLGFLLQPGMTELPYLSILDVGPSSSGLITLLQGALPADKKYLAVYKRLRMTREYAINPCDTELGCPFPLPAHKNFLIDFMSVLASAMDSSGKAYTPDGVAGVLAMCIDMAYTEYSPDKSPKQYSHTVSQDVADAVVALDIPFTEGETSWWEIVRALMEKGGPDYYHQASIAQRYAMPLIAEVAAKAKSPDITAVYTHHTMGGEQITDYVARTCGIETVQAYPVLGEETRFELGQARVVSLDLDEVVVSGDSAAATKQNAMIYLLASQVVSGRFFLSPEDVRLMPEWVRDYHKERIAKLRALPKRQSFDEWHRASAQPGAAANMDTKCRESRKWNLHLSFASQQIGDFSSTLTEESTSQWVLGYGTENGIRSMQERLGLGTAGASAIRRLPSKPTAAGGTFLGVMKTEEGEVCQTVVNTLGSQMLWAFSTTAEDMAMRNALYERIGANATLRTLATAYPGGSAKAMIERQRAAATGRDVIADLVDQLANKAERK
jgi:intracellular multiplication protein IcmB